MKKDKKVFFIAFVVLTGIFIMTSCDGDNGDGANGVEDEDWDRFGKSVAISGDYVVVGSIEEHSAMSGRGGAYIYERNYGGPDNWGEMVKLTASDVENVDSFSLSVSMSGDYVVVGAPLEDVAGSDRGGAYIYERNYGGPDNWGEVMKLTASDAEDWDRFGHSVAISGDYVVVGAHLEDGAGTDRGAAYIYERNYGGPDNWGEVMKLTASDAENADYFGYSVAISGDYVGVGAHLEDGAGSASGAAYIYERNYGGPDNWGEVVKLTALDADVNDVFGRSVAIRGDYVVVGAHLEDGAGSDLGTAYIYERNYGGPDNWGEMVKLTASDAEYADEFGHSIAISGDYVVVSAYLENGAGIDRGAAYIYERNYGGPDNWGEMVKLTASDADDNDVFGRSVAISGDYVVVGALGPIGRGAAYIYERNYGGPDNWGEVVKLTASDAENTDRFIP
jgi:hypothetical protein